MKILVAAFAICLLSSATFDAPCHGADDVDWEKRAAGTSWAWPDREPSLFLCTMRANEPYQILLEHIWNERFLVHITQKEKVLFKFKAHDLTVFEVFGNILVYADFRRSSPGCNLVAFDLATGKELWKTLLRGSWTQPPVGGNPIRGGLRYSNHVALTRHVGVVQVSAREPDGNSYEYIDLKTGKSLAHRLFEKESE